MPDENYQKIKLLKTMETLLHETFPILLIG